MMPAPKYVTTAACEKRHGIKSWLNTGLMSLFIGIVSLSVGASWKAVDTAGDVSQKVSELGGDVKTHCGIQLEKDKHIIDTLDRIEATQQSDHAAVEKILRTVNGTHP